MKYMLVAACAAAALVFTGSALADQTYNDSTGEASGSADISTVAVSNDTSAATITFAVQTNMTTQEPNSEIDVFVDADHNLATGSNPGGYEYLFGLDPDGWFFDSWNGSDFADVAGVTDLDVRTSPNGLVTFTVPLAELNTPTAVNFSVLTLRGPDPNNPVIDVAPDSGVWSYTLTTPPPPPPPPAPKPTPVSVTSVAATAVGVPHSGKVFRVSGLIVDLSNSTTTKAKSLKCTATLGGKHLAGTGAGGCTFHVPAKAKGKRLIVKVTGAYKTSKISTSLAYKVK